MAAVHNAQCIYSAAASTIDTKLIHSLIAARENGMVRIPAEIMALARFLSSAGDTPCWPTRPWGEKQATEFDQRAHVNHALLALPFHGRVHSEATIDLSLFQFVVAALDDQITLLKLVCGENGIVLQSIGSADEPHQIVEALETSLISIDTRCVQLPRLARCCKQVQRLKLPQPRELVLLSWDLDTAHALIAQ